jgi:hypothetical protein
MGCFAGFPGLAQLNPSRVLTIRGNLDRSKPLHSEQLIDSVIERRLLGGEWREANEKS